MKLMNIILLGMALSFVSCGHFGSKSCCADKAQCEVKKDGKSSCSKTGDHSKCADGQCIIKKKK